MAEFDYKIRTTDKLNVNQSWNSPRNLPKIKMYFYFLFGSFALISLLFLAVWGVENQGVVTYQNYLKKYWELFGNSATLTVIIMFFINLFWIIINLIINYLAYAQKWIPQKKPTEMTLEEKTKIAKINWPEDSDKLEFEERQKNENLAFDNEEYAQILKNPFLSPFAFLWLPVKKTYRSLSYLPKKLQKWWQKFQKWLQDDLEDWEEFVKNCVELFWFFLNPLNILDEIIDFLITLLVRFFYPMLLTPIIFFLPIKMEYIFGNFNFVLEVFLYFLTIGGLRVGVAFFSIYLRFLRNNRS